MKVGKSWMFVACGSEVTFNSFHISQPRSFIFPVQGISYFPTFICAFAIHQLSAAKGGTAFENRQILRNGQEISLWVQMYLINFSGSQVNGFLSPRAFWGGILHCLSSNDQNIGKLRHIVLGYLIWILSKRIFDGECVWGYFRRILAHRGGNSC